MACSLAFTPAFLQQSNSTTPRRAALTPRPSPRPKASATRWGEFTPRRSLAIGAAAAGSIDVQLEQQQQQQQRKRSPSRPWSATQGSESTPVRREYVPPSTRTDHVRPARPSTARPLRQGLSSPNPASRPTSARPQSARRPESARRVASLRRGGEGGGGGGGGGLVWYGSLGSDRSMVELKLAPNETLLGPFCEFDALRPARHLEEGDDGATRALIEMGVVASRSRSATPSVVKVSLSRPVSARGAGSSKGGEGVGPAAVVRNTSPPRETASPATRGGASASAHPADDLEWAGRVGSAPGEAIEAVEEGGDNRSRVAAGPSRPGSAPVVRVRSAAPNSTSESTTMDRALAPRVRPVGGDSAPSKRGEGAELARRLAERMHQLGGEANEVPKIEAPVREFPSPVKPCRILEDMLVAMRQHQPQPGTRRRPLTPRHQAAAAAAAAAGRRSLVGMARASPSDGIRMMGSPRINVRSPQGGAGGGGERGLWSVEGGTLDSSTGASEGDVSSLTACITKARPASAPSKRVPLGSWGIRSKVDYTQYIRCGREAVTREFNSLGTEKYLRRLQNETIHHSDLPSPPPPARYDMKHDGNPVMVIQSYSSQGSEVANVEKNSSAQGKPMDGGKEAEAVSEEELPVTEEGQVIRAVTPTVRVAFTSPGHSRPASRASVTDFGDLSRASSCASERKAVGAS